MQSLANVYFYSSAWWVVLIFVFALLHKLRERTEFISALAGYRLVPEGALRYWWLLPLLEFSAVLELLLTIGASRWLALSLFVLYAVAISINLLRGRRHIDCGCGGDGTAIGWGLVVRNVVLAGLALPQQIPPGDLIGVGVALTICTIALGWLGYGIFNQLFANSVQG